MNIPAAEAARMLTALAIPAAKATHADDFGYPGG